MNLFEIQEVMIIMIMIDKIILLLYGRKLPIRIKDDKTMTAKLVFPDNPNMDNPFISKKGNLINRVKPDWKLRDCDPQWLEDYLTACRSLGMYSETEMKIPILRTNDMQTNADDFNYDSKTEEDDDVSMVE